jgi:beta-glucosidase
MFDEFSESSEWRTPRNLEAVFDAVSGTPVDLVVEFELEHLHLGAGIRFLWKDFRPADFSEASALARSVDAVIYIGGTNHDYDKEAIGWGDVPYADIPDLELPGPQAELISALADANRNLAVVLVNGSVVSMNPWLNKASAVLEAWYPGMEGGHAVADVLFGDAEPGGRLPCSFAKDLGDYACHALGAYPGVRTGDDPHVEYREGIFVGYRHLDRAGIEPEFPFGFGLSYTRFECRMNGFRVVNDSAGEPEIRITCQVKNTGPRSGSQVIQLYVSDTRCSEERPLRELRGFIKLTLNAGECRETEFILGFDDFAFWSTEDKRWLVEAGEFTLFLGTSSREFFASQTLELKA